MQTKKKISLNNIPLYEISGSYTSRGCEALYYSMGDSKYGLKLYKTFSLAYESYKRQMKAAQLSLGPKVGKFIMAKKKGKKSILFGYETQKAEEYNDENHRHKKIYIEQEQNLWNELKKIGLAGDFGDVNCGIIDGMLVAVDFGSHSDSDRKIKYENSKL